MSQILILNTSKIRKACHGHGQTLAKALGIHHSTLSKKLNARLEINLRELNTIAQYLKRDALDFLIVESPRH
jgi:transcriptional regulator with XRE-family HTH domain